MMLEQDKINKLLGRPDHLLNSPPIDQRLMNKGDGGFLLKSHDKFSSQGISPIKAGIGGTTMKNHDELVIPTH
jgi:hypothetical protein